MIILVTGGTGFLGQHTARRLLAQGHQVYLLGRDFATATDLLTQGAVPVVADLRTAAAVSAAESAPPDSATTTSVKPFLRT